MRIIILLFSLVYSNSVESACMQLRLASDCLGCAHVIDARCRYWRSGAFFHRVYECLLPLYGPLVEQLQELAARPGIVCILGERDVIYPFLKALDTSHDVVFINEQYTTDSRCRCGNHSLSCPGRELPPRRRWLPMLPYRETGGSYLFCDPLLYQTNCTRHSASVLTHSLLLHISQAGLHLAHAHAATNVRTVVLVTRTANSLTTKQFSNLANGTRQFSHQSLKALRAKLASLPSTTVREYAGNESVRSTLSLFSQAQAVVGVHGAGLTNSVFAVHPVSVIEISTFTEPRRPWRDSGYVLRRWHKAMRWHTMYIPAETFISSGFELGWFRSYDDGKNTRARVQFLKDKFLTTISAVGLSSGNITSIHDTILALWRELKQQVMENQ